MTFMKDIDENVEHDWFDDLTEDQQQGVFRAIEQLDRGEGIPHEEALIRFGLSAHTILRTKANDSGKEYLPKNK